MVHRDLKPANVLMSGDGTIKLADFGIGGLMAAQAVQASRIGTVAASPLSLAEQASLFRGAGTPLYMSPEQRRGEPPDPRHDLYSLGVMWYQLLIGDVTREMSHGWARELAVKFAVPREQIELIERCVGWIEERPGDAGKLLPLLPLLGSQVEAAGSSLPPSTQESAQFRQFRFVTGLRQLLDHHRKISKWQELPEWVGCAWVFALPILVGLFTTAVQLLAEGRFAAVLGGLAIVAGVVGLLFWLRRKGRAQSERELATRIDELLAEFAQECQPWGGRAALVNQKILEEVLREVEAKSKREKHLDALAGKEKRMWQRADALVATKQPGKYDEAVEVLRDLRDLAQRAGAVAAFAQRLAELREKHASKRAFLERLGKAGLS
jgi:hypothetical protein